MFARIVPNRLIPLAALVLTLALAACGIPEVGGAAVPASTAFPTVAPATTPPPAATADLGATPVVDFGTRRPHPDSPAALPFITCGTEVNRHSQGRDAAARDCFWRAYLDRRPASFTTTAYTIEGDPITHALTLEPTGAFQVVVDSKDRFGTSGISHHTCRTLARQNPNPPGSSFAGFVLGDCTGGDAPQIFVP